MVVMEEFGKALVVEPYLGTVVIGGGFLKPARAGRRGRPDRQDHRRRGDLRLRLRRAAGPLPWADLKTTARKDGGGWC
jgi:hypothetical protein